ncbi:peptide ABC transporter ATP-binding protein [Philodulcilactobacillus myokoensis]|uniref:Peptide ABC transporter ATP-binding protein n=1 Tax=Philodulcilactobacillus myokoensis TaxID=2929573 RepID=A0A9W6AZ97_9LACO|nr:DMT family transporter [Philodulcilactobacillus myokoensis]GLB46279.1 peptide ABC transporter ATP-binding protein [Philodulcilactobacillus myokoensis]
MGKKQLGIFLVVLGGLCWGVSGTVAQFMFTSTGVSPVWVVGIRLFFGGLILLSLYIMMNHASIFTIWHDHHFRISLIYFSFFGILPSQFSYFMAVNYGNAATATILQLTGPVFIIMYLVLRKIKAPGILDFISIFLALFGSFLLVTSGSITSISLSPLGIFWGLMAGVAAASYTIIPVKLLKNYDAKLVCGWAMLLGSIPFFPYFILCKQPQFTSSLLTEMVVVVLIGTVCAYLFYVSSLEYIRPETTGMLSSIEPLSATILSIIFLGLRMDLVEIIGGLLILMMVLIQSMSDKIIKVFK